MFSIKVTGYLEPDDYHAVLYITSRAPLPSYHSCAASFYTFSSASQEKAGTATVSCGHYEADSETTASLVPVVSLTFTH